MIKILQKRSIYITLVVLAMCSAPLYAHAADISLNTQTTIVRPGSTIAVDAVLGALEGDINALDIVVDLEGAAGEIVGVTTRSSVVTFWIDEPTYTATQIHASGIIPGGYNSTLFADPLLAGLEDIILTFYINILEEGTITLHVNTDESELFLNDGEATTIPIATSLLTITGLQSAELVETKEQEDTTAPYFQDMRIVRSNQLYDGHTTLVFSVADKESGISYTEIKEGSADWRLASSPVKLSWRSWFGDIGVKAVDASGNVRIEHIAPPFRLPLIFGVFILFVLGVLIWYRVYRKWESS